METSLLLNGRWYYTTILPMEEDSANLLVSHRSKVLLRFDHQSVWGSAFAQLCTLHSKKDFRSDLYHSQWY